MKGRENECGRERGKEISGVYGSIKCKSNKQAIEKRAQNFVSPKNFYSMNKLNYMIAIQDGNEKVWMAHLLRNGKEIGEKRRSAEELRIMSYLLLKRTLIRYGDTTLSIAANVKIDSSLRLLLLYF